MNRYIAELIITDEENNVIGFETSSSFETENDDTAREKLLDDDPQCRVKRLYKEVTDIETKKCIDEQEIRKEFIDRICGKFKDNAVITTVLRNAMSDVLKEYEGV